MVVIPTCERETPVQGATDSVLAQEVESVAILVVDDGSRDGTTCKAASAISSSGVSSPSRWCCIVRTWILDRLADDQINLLEAWPGMIPAGVPSRRAL
jgi:hypothetical protein